MGKLSMKKYVVLACENAGAAVYLEAMDCLGTH